MTTYDSDDKAQVGTATFVGEIDDSGGAVVNGERSQFSGADIMDAASTAVAEHLSDDDPEAFLHLHFRSGIYDIANRLAITGADAKEADGIKITGEGKFSTQFFTNDLSGGWIIEIDPQAGTTASDRIWGVEVSGMDLDHRDSPGTQSIGGGTSDRDEDAIRVNDTRGVVSRDVMAQGYGTGLELQNVWQADVNNLTVRTSGLSGTPDKSPIMIKTGDTDGFPPGNANTGNAVNHVIFDHLQGGNIVDAVPFLKAKSFQVDDENGDPADPTISSLIIDTANVECADAKFFKAEGQSGVIDATIADNQCKDPDPLVHAATGTNHIQILGGLLESGNQILLQEAGRVSIKGLHTKSLGGSKDIIEVTGGWTHVDGVHTFGGARGISHSGNELLVSNTTFNNLEEEAVNTTGNMRINLDGLMIRNACQVDNNGENPIKIQNATEVTLDNLIVGVDTGSTTRKAINDQFSTDILNIGTVVPYQNTVGIVDEHSDTKYATRGGSATISNGNKSTSVTHQLVGTPTIDQIQITPTDDLGTASYYFVDNITSTSFDINVDTDPGADVTFGWRGTVLVN